MFVKVFATKQMKNPKISNNNGSIASIQMLANSDMH